MPNGWELRDRTTKALGILDAAIEHGHDLDTPDGRRAAVEAWCRTQGQRYRDPSPDTWAEVRQWRDRLCRHGLRKQDCRGDQHHDWSTP